MFDISIPWSVVLLMAPILMWFVSIPGALLAGYGWYRRKKNFYAALVAAVAGAFLSCWALLGLAAGFDAFLHLSSFGQGALGLLLLLAMGAGVLWGVSHAVSRRR